MSATEAEYIAASESAMESVWIRKFISGLGIVPTINEPINMFCDNSVAILIANKPGVQRGAIHYHRRYHYVRECIELGEINLLKFHTDDNLADPFTKTLPKGKLTQHARSMGLRLASSFMMCTPNSHDIHKMHIGLPQLTRLSLYGLASLSESFLVILNKVANKDYFGSNYEECDMTLKIGVRKCKRWYWHDPELDNSWYRGHLYEMYALLNPHQRKELATELTSQEQLAVLQDEYALVQVKLKKSQKNASF
ncbi:hypothetical protein Tco_0798959 [Tanacetum coccineum]